MTDHLLDTRELAAYLGINEKQVYALIASRGLPGTKVTGKWLFPRHLIDRWIEAHVQNMPPNLGHVAGADGLLLVAGSDDPLLGRLLSLYRKTYPQVIPLQSRAGSTEGLLALRRGLCHLACVHLAADEKEAPSAYLGEGTGREMTAVCFARRSQGLIVAKGNPMNIMGLESALRPGLRWALREVGTGTRTLLEREMDARNLPMEHALEGAVTAESHFQAALAILTGRADVGLAIEAAARQVGLDFIPVKRERFDLVARRDVFFEPRVQNLLVLLGGQPFSRMAEELGGYDIQGAGTLLTEGR